MFVFKLKQDQMDNLREIESKHLSLSSVVLKMNFKPF